MHKHLEELSSLQHDIWSSWVNYLFRTGTLHPNGSFTIPADKVEKWKKQIATYYEDLSEPEKQYNRDQAKKIINFLNTLK